MVGAPQQPGEPNAGYPNGDTGNSHVAAAHRAALRKQGDAPVHGFLSFANCGCSTMAVAQRKPATASFAFMDFLKLM